MMTVKNDKKININSTRLKKTKNGNARKVVISNNEKPSWYVAPVQIYSVHNS